MAKTAEVKIEGLKFESAKSEEVSQAIENLFDECLNFISVSALNI